MVRRFGVHLGSSVLHFPMADDLCLLDNHRILMSILNNGNSGHLDTSLSRTAMQSLRMPYPQHANIFVVLTLHLLHHLLSHKLARNIPGQYPT